MTLTGHPDLSAIVGTVLMLLFLLALYVTWFRVKAPFRSSVLTHKVIAISERYTQLEIIDI